MLLPIDVHFVSVVSNGIRFSDQGIDIGMPCGTPIVAVADGVVVYSGPSEARAPADQSASGAGQDGRLLVLIRFDKPVVFEGQAYCWARYENLSRLDFQVSLDDKQTVEVKAGQRLGRSGIAFGVPHLNFRLLGVGYLDTLLADKKASPGRAMPREQLLRFLWQKVAQAQLGFKAVR